MSFRFALAPILRLRQSIERQRTLQLQESQSRRSPAPEETLAQLERFLSESDQFEFGRARRRMQRRRTPVRFAFCARTCSTSARNSSAEIRKLELLRQKGTRRIPSGLSRTRSPRKLARPPAPRLPARAIAPPATGTGCGLTCCNAGIVAAEFRLNGWAYFLPGVTGQRLPHSPRPHSYCAIREPWYLL